MFIFKTSNLSMIIMKDTRACFICTRACFICTRACPSASYEKYDGWFFERKKSTEL